MVQCDLCGKALKNLSGLAGHRQLVHGILPRDQLVNQQLDRIEKAVIELEKKVDELLGRQPTKYGRKSVKYR